MHEILAVLASHLGAQALSRHEGFSSHGSWALEQRLSSCGHGDSRSEPVESPWARAGILNYLTTRSPPRSPFRNIIGGSV